MRMLWTRFEKRVGRVAAAVAVATAPLIVGLAVWSIVEAFKERPGEVRLVGVRESLSHWLHVEDDAPPHSASGPFVEEHTDDASAPRGEPYPWHRGYEPDRSLARRFPAPPGFRRVAVDPGSYEEWLRWLPLKPPDAPVRLHTGQLKGIQHRHAAVVDIDVGHKDLQQCADAAIRLRAEYLYHTGAYDAIGFRFTSGDRVEFSRWLAGERPVVAGDRVSWRAHPPVHPSRTELSRYLETIFMYAGTLSLSQELEPVRNVQDVRIGDLFIWGGLPGHAVIVVDVAEHEKTGARAFILAQSHMPAQDIHVLHNPEEPRISPWYRAGQGNLLKTPTWWFEWTALKRFPSSKGEQTLTRRTDPEGFP